jgi:uncharacterized protein (DUF427 family)
MPFDAPTEPTRGDRQRSILTIVDAKATVRVELDGVAIARSSRARVLHEPGKLPRHYVPLLDVEAHHLRASRELVHAGVKGCAQLLDLVHDGRLLKSAAWRWLRPTDETRALIEHVCFAEDGRLSLFLDDVRVSLLEPSGP